MWNNKLYQFQKDEEFIPLESFVSFQDFYKHHWIQNNPWKGISLQKDSGV